MKLLLTLSVVFLVGVTIVIYSQSNQNTASPIPSPQKAFDSTSQNSKYVIDGINRYQSNISEKRVLYFYADWCPTCRPVDKEFASKEDDIPDDVTIYRINYNDSNTDESEKELANKYAVTYQHTFVRIDESGNEISKWNGGGLKELIENIK